MWTRTVWVMGMLGVAAAGWFAQPVAAEHTERTLRVASVTAETLPVVNRVSGEIAWVDVRLGTLQLKDGAHRDYRMNAQATNVTDPSDRRFLTLEDLRSGQQVAIEFDVAEGSGERMARTITVNAAPDPAFQAALGTLEAIDARAGTLVLRERSSARERGGSHPVQFLFDPREIVVMQSPSRQPVRLELKPGDPVKVEYVVTDGTRWARTVTLYAALPELSEQTTTTTTVTTTTR